MYPTSLSSAKRFAKNMRFATIREYTKYVTENGLALKANPSEYKGYVSAADFLGMTPEEYKKSKFSTAVANRDQELINRKISLHWANKRANRIAEIQSSQPSLELDETNDKVETPTENGLNPDLVIQLCHLFHQVQVMVD